MLKISIPPLPLSPNSYGIDLKREKPSNNHQASVKANAPNNQQQLSVNHFSKSGGCLDSSGSQTAQDLPSHS
jgi:hypothetical protein